MESKLLEPLWYPGECVPGRAGLLIIENTTEGNTDAPVMGVTNEASLPQSNSPLIVQQRTLLNSANVTIFTNGSTTT